MEFFMDGCTLYAFLREEGGTRSVTEGECVPVSLSRFILWIWFIYSGTPSAEYQIYRDAFSLSHLR